MIFLYGLYILLGFYSLFLLFIFIGIFRIKNCKDSLFFNDISVIVAAHNEEKDIANLLDFLSFQEYPKDKYEVIIINDRSRDNTEGIIKKYSEKYNNIKYLKIDKEDKNLVGKKNALTKGIEQSNGNILLFTDADCVPGKNWLKSINNQFNLGFDVVVGYSPLVSYNTKTIFQKFVFLLKRLERLSIFSISAGTIGWNWGVTATGRNFAYRKRVFKELNGFSGIGHIPSGDDDLFLQKISKSKKYKISFAKDKKSFVNSVERKSAKEQINQEKRRASKWIYYPLNIKIYLALIFVFYLFLFISFVMAIFSSFSWNSFLGIFIVKVIFDFLIVIKGAILFRENRLLWIFPLAEIFYIPYFLIFGILGTFTRYRWHDK
ncbi:MAG: glycosyltransferase [Candidatus Cloacimonetes bacterium]|nr:glycosyltransferase [Candidatus Cloacimonadota bacterium]